MRRIAGLAVALIAALVPVSTRADDARAVAVGVELGTGAAAQLELAAPAGLPRSAMTPPQRAALRELVEVYLAHFVPAIADHDRARIADDADRVHFLFAGSLVAGEPSYYRIRGPSFLIEFDNTDEDADHIHIVWRDLEGDLGRDVLREHHRAHH